MESLLSILDKLQKDQPLAEETLATSGFRQSRDWRERYLRTAIAAYRSSVQRDLEWLLNTRRMAPPDDQRQPERKELETSVFCYGLPSFSYVSLSPEAQVSDTNRLAKDIERTIGLFEPRILNPRVIVEQMPAHDREIRFRVSGKLKMKPQPELVQYRTLLDVESGRYQVEVSE